MMKTSKVERILLNLGFKCDTVETKEIDTDTSVSQNTFLGQRWGGEITILSKTANTVINVKS